jgi:hypothetical protein
LVSVEMTLCRSSPEHRRLRFSFHINNVKDPNQFPGPPFSARCGGGGYLVASIFRVNRPFQALFSPPGDPVLKSAVVLLG